MKISKLTASILLFSSITSLSAATLTAKANQWQMTGFGIDTDLSKNELINSNDYKIIWFYENGWKAYSVDSLIKEKIENNLNVEFDSTLNSSQGFWILPKVDLEIPKYENVFESFPREQGWHFLSYAKGIKDVKKFLSNVNAMQTFYVFRDGAWEYLNRSDNSSLFLGNLNNIEPSEGFWLYNNADITNYDYEIQFNHEWERASFDEVFSNKRLSYENTVIEFNQDGYVESNDQRFNNAKWRGDKYSDYYSWGEIGFTLSKENINYSFNIAKSWDYSNNISGGFVLNKITKNNVKKLDNGLLHILSSEVIYHNDNYLNLNSNNLSISIVNNTISTSNQTVQAKMQELDDILNTSNTDIKSKLSQIKRDISSINHSDADVLISVINLIEVLDEDILKSILTFDGSAFDMNSFFSSSFYPSSAEELLKFSETITNYGSNASTLLSTLASKLKSTSNLLEVTSRDKNYVFLYKDTALNSTDIMALRGFSLAIATKLQLLSSYEFGSDFWFETKIQDNMEYVQASIDPVSYINSGEFLSSPASSKLTTAKGYFVEFLSIYKDMIDGEFVDKEGLELKASSLDKRNMIFYLDQLLANLNGDTTEAFIPMDNSYYDMQNYKEFIEKEFFKIDLNSLFDSSKTITSADFPKLMYQNNQSINTLQSIFNNAPSDNDGIELEVINDDSTIPTSVNNINNIFKSFVDKDGNFFSNNNLIQEIFN